VRKTAITVENFWPPKTAPGTTRWVASRKASLVHAINEGLLTLEEAGGRYSLSLEELLVWQERLGRHGPRGLHASHLRTSRAIRTAP
jgi:hypothetical protein